MEKIKKWTREIIALVVIFLVVAVILFAFQLATATSAHAATQILQTRPFNPNATCTYADNVNWRNWGGAPYGPTSDEALTDTKLDWYLRCSTAIPENLKTKVKASIRANPHGERIAYITPDMVLPEMASGPDRVHRSQHIMRNVRVARIVEALGVVLAAETRTWSVKSDDGTIYDIGDPFKCGNLAVIRIVRPTVSMPVVTTTPAVPVSDISAVCSTGFTLFAHARSLRKLPNGLRERAISLIKVAEGRDTKFATNPTAYLGDDVSRSLYAAFSSLPNDQIDAVIGVQLLDPSTLKVVEDLGTSQITGGIGEIKLMRNQLMYAIQVVWPDNFESPPVSGYLRRLIVMPSEWDNAKGGKFFCKHATGLAP
jgi:hypothetical protein